VTWSLHEEDGSFHEYDAEASACRAQVLEEALASLPSLRTSLDVRPMPALEPQELETL
jgi:hypothetical protein